MRIELKQRVRKARRVDAEDAGSPQPHGAATRNPPPKFSREESVPWLLACDG